MSGTLFLYRRLGENVWWKTIYPRPGSHLEGSVPIHSFFPRNRQSIFATIVKVFLHLSRSFTDRAEHENDVSIDCVNYTRFLPPATVVSERQWFYRCLSVQGVCVAGECLWREDAWQWDVHGWGHAWWGTCMAGGHVWQGACMGKVCMEGGMHGRGHAWQGCAWQGACMRACVHVRGYLRWGHVWEACVVGDTCGEGDVCMVGDMHGGGVCAE